MCSSDLFIGCFIQHWTRSRDIRAAMVQAVAYSACSVTGLGTQTSYPDADAFAEFQRAFDA